MIFLQQLSCGYEFPALIHVWIASAGVLEWFTSTRAVAGKSHIFYSRILYCCKWEIFFNRFAILKSIINFPHQFSALIFPMNFTH